MPGNVSYKINNWKRNDLITSDKLNNIEQGIKAVDDLIMIGPTNPINEHEANMLWFETGAESTSVPTYAEFLSLQDNISNISDNLITTSEFKPGRLESTIEIVEQNSIKVSSIDNYKWNSAFIDLNNKIEVGEQYVAGADVQIINGQAAMAIQNSSGGNVITSTSFKPSTPGKYKLFFYFVGRENTYLRIFSTYGTETKNAEVIYSNIFLNKIDTYTGEYLPKYYAKDNIARNEIQQIKQQVNSHYQLVEHTWVQDFAWTKKNPQGTYYSPFTDKNNKKQPGYYSSTPRLIHKRGLYIYVNPKYNKALEDSNPRYKFYVIFLKKEKGKFVIADEYYNKHPGLYEHATGTTRSFSGYFEYMPNIYYSISKAYYNKTELICNDDYTEEYELLDESGYQELPNTSTGYATLLNDHTNIDISSKTFSSVVGRALISLLPLNKVEHIICNPNFNLLAQIYSLDPATKTRKIEKTIWSNRTNNNNNSGGFTTVFGTNFIDFSDYNDKEGYILLCIKPTGKFRYKPNTTEYGVYADDNLIIGAQGSKMIKQNVFVKYKFGIHMTINDSISPILKHNLDMIRKPIVNDAFPHKYRSTMARQSTDTNYLQHVPLLHYGAYYAWNTPLLQVSLESYVSAAKNIHSYYYDYYKDYTDNQTGNGLGNKGYGMNCGSVVSIACGFDMPLPACAVANKIYPEYFDILPFDTRLLQPGDVIAYAEKLNSDSHVMIVESLTYFDGALFSINYVEGWPPTVRENCLIEQPQYNSWKNIDIIDLLGLKHESQKFEHPIIARPKQEAIHLLIDKHNFYTDYNNITTNLMVDRGHNSVYGADDNAIYLTITNYSDINGIELYHEEYEIDEETQEERKVLKLIKSLNKNIDLTPLINSTTKYRDNWTELGGEYENHDYFINLKPFIDEYKEDSEIGDSSLEPSQQYSFSTKESGFWVVKEKGNNAIKERFYVAPRKHVACVKYTDENQVEKIRIIAEDSENIAYVFCAYTAQYPHWNTTLAKTYINAKITKIDEQNNGVCIIDNKVYKEAHEESLAAEIAAAEKENRDVDETHISKEYTFNYALIVYNAPENCGTYYQAWYNNYDFDEIWTEEAEVLTINSVNNFMSAVPGKMSSEFSNPDRDFYNSDDKTTPIDSSTEDQAEYEENEESENKENPQ